MRLVGRTLVALSALLLIALGAVLLLVHPRYLLGTLSGDDAGYYLAVARNYVLGHGFSFDRVAPTNGFNPLMPMLLIPLDRVVAPGLDLVACFRIGMFVTWAAMVAGWVSLLRLSSRVLSAHGVPEGARDLAVGAVSFWLAAFVAPKGYHGMDAFLVLAAGASYLSGVSAHGILARGARHAVRDGALLALAVLARVDSLPLAMAAFLVMARAERTERGAARALLARLAVFVAGVAPYLLWNLFAFSDWLPISARLKSSFPVLDLATSLRTVFGSSLNLADELVLVLSFAVALGWTAAELRRARRVGPSTATGAHDAMAVLALGLAARLAWLLLFSRLDVQGSYFILAHPFLALAGLVIGSRVAGGRGNAAMAAALTCAGVALLTLKLLTTLPAVRAIAAGDGDEWNIGRSVHDAVPEGSVIYGGAFGLIGYIADRAWINGDGVANDHAYQDAIAGGRLAHYLRERSVDVIAVAVSPPREPGRELLTLGAGSPLHAARDSILLDPREIFLRQRMRRNGGTDLWLVRWGDTARVQEDEVSSSRLQPSR